jgi:predicted patatin/cPLA2 family phospholipase
MNASYFLSCQPDLGITVYYDSLATRQFINPLRFWKILDVDYVFDHVVTVAKPLDVGRMLASRSKLFVAVMDKRTSEGILIDTKTTPTPLLRVLKAATAIPVLYNKTVEVEGRPCADGGLIIPFPIEQALRNGCTGLLVLLTHTVNYLCPPAGWGGRLMFNLLFGQANRELRHIYASHDKRETAARNLALGNSPTSPTVKIATICTDESETVHRTTIDRATLRAAAVRYGRKVMRVFGADAEAWDLAPLTYS